MADRRYKFWVHGVDTHVQYEERTAHIRRNVHGTRIRQNAKEGLQQSENWFHLAIPTPTLLNSHEVEYVDAFLKGKVNEHASIKEVQILCKTQPVFLIKSENYGDNGVSDTDFNLLINLPDQRCDDPLVMSVLVHFWDGGEIFFGGAGVRFDEKS